MDKKIRNRYYRRLLLDEVSNKQKRLKLSNRQLKNETNLLNDTTTWMKGVCICCSINLAIICYFKNIQQTIAKSLIFYGKRNNRKIL